MALVFKRYFLKEMDRIKYEELVFELKPELTEKVFNLDDYELQNLVGNIQESQVILSATS